MAVSDLGTLTNTPGIQASTEPGGRFIPLRELKEKEALERAAERSRLEPKLQALAHLIKTAFQRAQDHRQTIGITDRILDSKRQVKGEYDPETLTEIDKQGGSKQFFNITATKTSTALAWIVDVMFGSGDKPWSLTHTPIPELPTDTSEFFMERINAKFPTKDGDPKPDPLEFAQFTLDLYDEELKTIVEDAKERVARHETKIEDQLIDGEFATALQDFLQNLTTFPVGILKGPTIRRKDKLTYEKGQAVVKSTDISCWDAPSPFDIYPSPGARNPNEGYIIEMVRFDRAALSAMKGLEGWNNAAIDGALLDEGTNGTGNDIHHAALHAHESERADLENRDHDRPGRTGAPIEGLEYWGTASTDMLLEWGFKKGKDEELPENAGITDYHEICAILIGDNVVKTTLNPDPLKRRPYMVTSFEKQAGEFWGKSIAEKMEDVQKVYNATNRALVNNLALASGFMVAYDIAALPSGDFLLDMEPHKVYQYQGSKTGGRNPVTFFQPDSNATELLAVAEHFAQQSDDRTLIPRFAHGNDDVSGAGSTASGLNMLMQAAARGIKRVILNVDKDIIREAILRQYTWNLLHLPDESLKADAAVVPQGALAALIRESTQLRRQEALASTNNPTDLALMGMEGRANLLRESFSGLDMDVDKLVLPKDEIRRRAEQSIDDQAPPVDGRTLADFDQVAA